MADVLNPAPHSFRTAIDEQLATSGKFLRPLLLFKAGIVFGSAIDEQMIALATVLELVHMATLFHDDVLDDSSLRRGRQALHLSRGNKASILLGDYMLSKALRLLAQFGDRRTFQIVTDAVSSVCEGELTQHSVRGSLRLTEEAYLSIIKQKTGSLFSAAAQVGASLGGAPQEETQLLSDFGLYTGAAFQVADDYLDYAGSVEKCGKAIGTDLRDGVATLPLLYALKNATSEDQLFLKSCFNSPDVSDSAYKRILALFISSGALKYTARYASDLCQKAILPLLASSHSDKVASLCSFSSDLIRSRLSSESI
jgi:octaprenyl-diphosphate synthase